MTAAPRWQKSSYSQQGGDCIELATSHATLHLRESDNPRTVIRPDRKALAALLAHLKGQRAAQQHHLE